MPICYVYNILPLYIFRKSLALKATTTYQCPFFICPNLLWQPVIFCLSTWTHYNGVKYLEFLSKSMTGKSMEPIRNNVIRCTMISVEKQIYVNRILHSHFIHFALAIFCVCIKRIFCINEISSKPRCTRLCGGVTIEFQTFLRQLNFWTKLWKNEICLH